MQMFNSLSSTDISNSTDLFMSNNSTGDDICLLETRQGDHSLTEFDADDLLSASMFDDSNGSLDNEFSGNDEFSGDFEPTPMKPNPVKVQSTQFSQNLSMFEPTPIRTQHHLPLKQLPPAPRTMVDGQGFPIARPDSMSSAYGPPNYMVQNQQLQAALLHVRHQLNQQQAMMAMNGIVTSTAPVHRPTALIQSPIQLKLVK